MSTAYDKVDPLSMQQAQSTCGYGSADSDINDIPGLYGGGDDIAVHLANLGYSERVVQEYQVSAARHS